MPFESNVLKLDPMESRKLGRGTTYCCIALLVALLPGCVHEADYGADCPVITYKPAAVSNPCPPGDDVCATYFDVWKNQIKKKNGMSDSYFREHILPEGAWLSMWNSGISIRVSYSVRIAWATVKAQDSFVVYVESDPTYPYLPIRRDAYLNEEEVEAVLDAWAYSSHITTISPIEDLAFCSEDEALEALITIAGTDLLESRGLSYLHENRVEPADGHPYLTGFAELDFQKNECISGRIDLVTGIGEAQKSVCWHT